MSLLPHIAFRSTLHQKGIYCINWLLKTAIRSQSVDLATYLFTLPLHINQIVWNNMPLLWILIHEISLKSYPIRKEEYLYEWIELLISKGADINFICHNNGRHHPLSYIIKKSNLRLATIFMNHPHCNINYIPFVYEYIHLPISNLILAVQYSDDILERLLADPRCDNIWIDHDRETPLHKAAYIGSYRAVRMLIDAGFAIDPYNIMHQTPLHKAMLSGIYSKNNRHDIIQLLMKNGASLTTKDSQGKNALTMCKDALHIDPCILALHTLILVEQERRDCMAMGLAIQAPNDTIIDIQKNDSRIASALCILYDGVSLAF